MEFRVAFQKGFGAHPDFLRLARALSSDGLMRRGEREALVGKRKTSGVTNTRQRNWQDSTLVARKRSLLY